MPDQISVRIHPIAEDGYPDMDDPSMTGRVAFIFDGCVVSGWPLHIDPQDHSTPHSGQWEANSDVGRETTFEGVTHWVEFPVPMWQIGKVAAHA